MMSAQAGAHPTTQHEHDADNQQQYHQQQQQPYPPPHPYQHSYLPPSSFSSSLPLPPPPPPASAPAAAELSSLQYAQLQQLQYQQMQWQYLQQLQQQQMYLQQHQQTAAPGQFDPLAAAPQQAAGASQYRSAYQSYGDYSQAIDPNQQQLVAVDAQGRLVPVDPYRQVAPASGVVDTTAAGAVTGRDRAPPPAVDTNGWDGAITYPSKCNTDRYLTHRKYFSNIPPVINRLPRKPDLKSLVLKGRDFYANNRDPRFYNPVQEAGWDNRAQVVVKTNENASTARARAGSFAATSPPSVEEAKESFGHFPVLVDNSAANARPGSKLLVPFLHNWPPPFRFDYLKKHSRAPLSPFLASLNGYEVPPELYMTARQRAEQERHEAALREEQGYGGAYPPQEEYESASSARPSPHSLDPIERARARANTHTTYWRTVPAENATDADAGKSNDASQRSLADRGDAQSKPLRPEWNYRHHLKPPQPRVGQTTAKKPSGRRDRTQQQLRQQQQQQAAYINGQPLPPLMHNGQSVLPWYYPNGPMMPPMPFAPLPHDAQPYGLDPAQTPFEANQYAHAYYQPQYAPHGDGAAPDGDSTSAPPLSDSAQPSSGAPDSHEEGDREPHVPPTNGTDSLDAALASTSLDGRAPVPVSAAESTGSNSPGLSAHAQPHVQEMYAQLYKNDRPDEQTQPAASDDNVENSAATGATEGDDAETTADAAADEAAADDQ